FVPERAGAATVKGWIMASQPKARRSPSRWFGLPGQGICLALPKPRAATKRNSALELCLNQEHDAARLVKTGRVRHSSGRRVFRASGAPFETALEQMGPPQGELIFSLEGSGLNVAGKACAKPGHISRQG